VETDRVVTEILAATEQAQTQFVTGDSSGYEALFAHRDDVTLAGPFGGPPLAGWSAIEPRMRQAAGLFGAGGSGSIEVYQAIVIDDFACLVSIERDRVHFVHSGEEGRWELRVTQVYGRDGESWRIWHRHADPLTDRHSIGDILTFAYGDAEP
jgi:ketosteroid isomerase-like protein